MTESNVKEHIHFSDIDNHATVHGVAIISVKFKTSLLFPLCAYESKGDILNIARSNIARQILDGVEDARNKYEEYARNGKVDEGGEGGNWRLL